MVISADKVHPIQNMGLLDRVLRLGGGGLIVGMLVLYYEMRHVWLPLPVMFYVIAISLYPLLTAIIGWDPFYSLFQVRSCGDIGRNQCGTFPYQVKAIMGRAPKYCDSETERSLESCHDDAAERPRHQAWRVEQEPMLYPSDAQLDEYFKAHPTSAGKIKQPRRGKAA